MFGIFNSEKRKVREEARNWLEVADRVHKFRRDLLTPAQTEQLLAAAGGVRDRLQAGAEAGVVRQAVESLEKVLRTTGGRIYPVSSLVENVEFFVVAAIVILGLRAYFIQPFKIPTNSMWPTYYGMTPEVFAPGQEPGPLQRVVRLVTRGATRYSVVAPADGEVMFPIIATNGRPAVSASSGRNFLIFPSDLLEFTFAVDGQLATIKVPAEFDPLGTWLKKSFFPDRKEDFYSAVVDTANHAGHLDASELTLHNGARSVDARVVWVPLGRHVHRGETILSFDILTGDLLFVDRLSYNFVRPQVGSGFVFKTENIHSPSMERPDGTQIKEYYIKRLVGAPGDTLEVKPPVLWRNGKPIEGAKAFDQNARQEGIYPGYTAGGNLAAGEVLTIPPKNFFAMGDNSPDSKDSRYWGFVPEREVVGRPLFIYYPLTSRWGPAH